jgi:cation:H+ antiporter
MTIFSFILGGSLVKLETRLRVSGALLGMVAALGADTPEISSAVTALFIGQHDIGVGIIIGSSIFNITGLLGLSALVVGSLPLNRQGIIVNGVTSFIVILVLILLIYSFISPLVSLGLILLLMVSYVIISEIKPKLMKEWSLPEGIRVPLTKAIVGTRTPSKEHKIISPKSRS